ncbi:myc-associated zinc finger protein-like isoform X2 [Pollicipes pollicipes]|uniref:myc-associated zinc finger protein-like isoform X2 n=1 Tax=Pollicipes pollicipes TaxID=41117 RepID=UPI0018853408|nr:myc-associated zinc finger protein-like isoform X2 [Pollicipes pollicipes]
MAGLSITSLGRGQCCMLCCNQLYSTGFNIYQARTYHGEKSFYAKLLELTNYTASMPQLVSDSLCSVCATMVSQVDQLEYQLSHVISQIRALFHKMVQSQTEVAAARPGRGSLGPQGLPGGAARTSSTEVSSASSAYLPEVKSEPSTDPPPHASPYYAKKPPKENGTPSATTTRRPSWTPGLPAPPAEAPAPLVSAAAGAGQPDDGLFNIGAFLQTDLREPAAAAAAAAAAVHSAAAAAAAAAAVSSAGDFTDKFVRTVDSEDAYRFQCVLCSKLGDSAEVIRRHVRADHPGADRISFPGAAPAKRAKPSAGAVKPAASKVPRSITASSPAMAQKIAERAYVCAGCDKAFGCEAFLTRHVTAQHCGRMFSCQYCGKEFSRSDKKVRHERSHTGERPFSCGFCGKAFSRRDKCTYHEKSHTRHRPFECQRCGEVMFSAGAYATHRQSCSDEVQGTGSLWHAQMRPASAAPPAAAAAEAGDP